MMQRIVSVAAFVMVVGFLGADSSFAQTPKQSEWLYGLELAARKADEKELTDKTRKFGLEVYLYRGLDTLFYVTETGAVSGLHATGFTAPKEVKGWNRITAYNLPVRKPGENKFTDASKKIGVEVYRDENTSLILYVTETGAVSAVRGGKVTPSATAPHCLYGYNLRVRKGAEGDFTDATKKYGIEIFKDEVCGTLLYVSETGAIAAAPAGAVAGGSEVRESDWLFGLSLKVRKAAEKEFTDATRKWGVEVFKDDKAGNLIFISEAGDLGVAATGNAKPPDKIKKPTWLHDQNVRVRPAGVKEFDKARQWGIEIFRDENTANVVFITEAGSLAVLSPK